MDFLSTVLTNTRRRTMFLIN